MPSRTEYFASLAAELHRQPEHSDPAMHYEMFDSGGVECEVGDFLYGLVRVLKPTRVLTTGIYTGISDMYIAQALKDNGFGKSNAIEYESFHYRRAIELWKDVGVSEFIEPFLMPSLNFNPTHNYDFMFLDTEPEIRFAEFIRFYPFLNEGGYIGIHDLPRTFGQENVSIPKWPHGPFGLVPLLMKSLLSSGELSKIHLPSPRGLVFFYKRHAEDYQSHG